MESSERFPLGSGARIGHALALVFLLIVMMGVSFIGLAPLLPEGPFNGAPIEFVGLIVLTAISAGGVVGFCLVKVGRVSLRDLGWTKEHLRRDLLLGAAGFVVLACYFLLIGSIAGFWTPAEFFGEIAGYTFQQRLLFLLIGLQASFIEETVFRGYLQPALSAKLGNAGGMVLTAIIFAIYHLNPRPIALLSKLVQGLVFGLLKGKERSLYAPAAAHFLTWLVLGSL